MKDKIIKFWSWYKYSSLLVGVPVMLMVCTFALSRTLFTGTCLIATYKCQYAIGTDAVMKGYLSSLLGGSMDIVATPTKGKD